MQITKIQSKISFHAQNSDESIPNKTKPEFIDKLMSVVKNQSDVNDCVAVPRGIFKAYLWIMGGFGLLGIGGALPQKFPKTKTALLIAGNICNALMGQGLENSVLCASEYVYGSTVSMLQAAGEIAGNHLTTANNIMEIRKRSVEIRDSSNDFNSNMRGLL